MLMMAFLLLWLSGIPLLLLDEMADQYFQNKDKKSLNKNQ